MSLRSRYTKAEIKQLSKLEYMREATYQDMLEDYGVSFRVAYLARESTNHVDQVKALNVQVQQLEKLIDDCTHFRLASNCKFIESGKSGLSQEWRETFQLMLSMAKQQKFDILIVDAVSRLARNVGELFTSIELLKEYGIGVLILKGYYWTMNLAPADISRLAAEAGNAQAESAQTGIRVKSHMDTIAATGQLMGGDMFGYRLVKAVERRNNTYRIVEEEAEAVRIIFERTASDNPDLYLSTSALVPYLVENGIPTFQGDLNWTASKINRIIRNTKYMGYQLYGKSKITNPIKKTKVLTHIKPIRDEYDEKGVLVKKGNLTKGNWEPIVSEELWWKANERLSSNSKVTETGAKGCRSANDAIARKLFCSCGYSLSPQYTHAAKEEGKSAQFRYKCRWQINQEILLRSKMFSGEVVCDNPAVSEMKMWLQSKYVFEYVFYAGKEAIGETLRLLEQTKQEEEVMGGNQTLDTLRAEIDKEKKRLSAYINMKADGEITNEQYKEMYAVASNHIEELEAKVAECELKMAKTTRKIFDLDAIVNRLNSYVNLDDYKVSDEMIELYVERIIYRGNDEFVWVINLSGNATDSDKLYRIPKYDRGYADNLKRDSQFNIVHRFIIPVEECEQYCREVVKRRFVPRYWKNIIVKIAIC